MPEPDAHGTEYVFAMHYGYELGLRVSTRTERDLAVKEMRQAPAHQRIDALMTFQQGPYYTWGLVKVERVVGEHAILLSM